MQEHAKMGPPNIKSSCVTENQNSNPMGIGLGIDYAAWRHVQKGTPPTSNLYVGHGKKPHPVGIGLEVDYV